MKSTNKKIQSLLLILTVTISILIYPHESIGNENSLWEINETIKTTTDSIEKYNLKLKLHLLNPHKPIRVNLPLPQKTIEATINPKDSKDLRLSSQQMAWSGEIRNSHEIFILRIDSSYQIRLATPGRIYTIRSNDGVNGVMESYDPDYFKDDDHQVINYVINQVKNINMIVSCDDEHTNIDIMVIYTPKARDASGGDTQIKNRITNAIALANNALSISQAEFRINEVYSGLVDYNEPNLGVDKVKLLKSLQNPSDGVLDYIYGIRDDVKADLVSLIVEETSNQSCGRGNTVFEADKPGSDSEAFTVIKRTCADTYLSLAHEVGHNFGALHDRGNTDPSKSPFNYNFGHIQPNPSGSESPWSTIMSYPCPNCTRVSYFSNPNVLYDGDPTGRPVTTENPEYNILVFNRNDEYIANYRCQSRSIGIWMKDSWEDTGLEPDPATSGKAMWKSPYIWIRHAEDTLREHEHDHQDPKLGHENHLYVKVHNDSAANQTGKLELYYANASTNLNNPSDWTLIASHNETINPGVSVIRTSWNNLPGAGHYCLLARWNDDGSLLSFNHLSSAVQNDNDLIWRNVNIIDINSSLDINTGKFLMKGHKEFNKTNLTLNLNPRGVNNINWSNIIGITLNVDPNILPKSPNLKNLISLGNGKYRVPIKKMSDDILIGPFMLNSNQTTEIKLDISVDKSTASKVSNDIIENQFFDIDAKQVSTSDNQFELGGVTFTLVVKNNQK
ncbi:zinc-dependent metalloprotease [Photobacterium sp. TY1-4]|uniref:zinc-dependent metalloprotease n=1 Tax=Photobacterium sp. TY1-4 TaxID=2899122 RepID=UPI0021C05F18|nr:zinc-dependent metalloprotease [Photobacterium sp. TY1-4]UXI04716.1 zinc-dependent metalloprotease [Photobacterium sp. TY1-4]